ncbi:unnamed protein product [Musa textilis]
MLEHNSENVHQSIGWSLLFPARNQEEHTSGMVWSNTSQLNAAAERRQAAFLVKREHVIRTFLLLFLSCSNSMATKSSFVFFPASFSCKDSFSHGCCMWRDAAQKNTIKGMATKLLSPEMMASYSGGVPQKGGWWRLPFAQGSRIAPRDLQAPPWGVRWPSITTGSEDIATALHRSPQQKI